MSVPDQPSLKRGYALNAVHTTLNILYPIATFAFASRVLGPANLGKVNVSLALAAFFLVLAALALPLYGTKAIAQARGDQERLDGAFTGLFLLNGASSLFWAAAYALLLAANRTMQSEWSLYLAAGSCLAWNIFSVDWVYSGMEDFRSILFRNGAIKVAALILLVLLVRDEGDFTWFAFINVASAGFCNLWGFVSVRKHARLRWSLASFSGHLRPLLLISGSSVVAGIYLQLDYVILGSLTDDRAVGLYSAAMKVVRIATAFLVSLGLSMVPRISFYVKNTMDAEYRALIEKSVRLLFFLSAPMTAFLLALAPQILRLMSGPAFVEASLALRLASPILMLATFANFIGFQVLFPRGGEKALLSALSLAAATSLILNFLLIPGFGIVGCVIAAAGAETMAVLVLAFKARSMLGSMTIFGGPVFRYLGLSLALGAASWALAGRIEKTWLALAVAAATMGAGYLGLLRLIGDSVTLEFQMLASKLLSAPFRPR